MADLKFDIEKIRSMKERCDDLINNEENGLTAVANKLNESLEGLKNDWHTPAGEKFFADLDDEWTEQVEKYVGIVEAVSGLLEVAITEYTPVKEMAEQLNIEADY